jgi:hypothetical protein
VQFLDRQVKQERELRRLIKDADFSEMVAMRLLAHHLHLIIERESARRTWRLGKRLWMQRYGAEERIKRNEKQSTRKRGVKRAA